MRQYSDEHGDQPEHQYAYDFDYVLRGYMLRTFAPWFRSGKALEIGCFEGGMTAMIAEHFDDLTVVEAAADLVEKARLNVPKRVSFVTAPVETVEFGPEYESIFLVHTLEHFDAPTEVLARIKGWLTPTGQLYLVVPNADAASRQIAVKMGLIETNNAVMPAEALHGHRRTYSLDSLEHDARQAGLAIAFRGGIFFKPFANFQFDALIRSKVIDDGYLEGCFALGQQYPELSASIYLVCQSGLTK